MIQIKETNVYRKWFASLKDKKTRAIIDVHIRRVSLGNFGDVEPVGKGVSELKIDYGPGYRIYFKQFGDTLVILLCGGDKSTQINDIRRAYEITEKL